MPGANAAKEEIRALIRAIRNQAYVAREFPRFRARYRREAPNLNMEEVERELGNCRRCPLHEGRTHIVFGEGNPRAKLVFVGEAPGADEDRLGRPFVGKAGQLLTRIIEAMGMKRGEVYICNVLKCRPPQNRTPLPAEMEVCGPFLEKQLAVIKPTVICALGSIAAKFLLKTDAPITAIRGRFHDYRGIPCLPTYHPAYLLRNPAAKRQVWQDMKLIMDRLGVKG
ncbi:MAG TPA: uracil-DNA glycosylase family protein [Syntrophales bacterium]|nr:uracil-DNA glycosylase family protein [Syntrophales bacterium]HOL59827.1 uracil-DNA glycosylase family protein [Syntrophales bacterium]HPO35955.1 uracil-DNA glycosylase family protein [Syntrophales bacterium]